MATGTGPALGSNTAALPLEAAERNGSLDVVRRQVMLALLLDGKLDAAATSRRVRRRAGRRATVGDGDSGYPLDGRARAEFRLAGRLD